MPNLRVKVRGTPRPAEIDAATIEDDKENSEFRAKDANGQLIARFDLKEVCGWWIEPPTEQQTQGAELVRRLEEGRKRAAKR